jgi:Spy/CpxP family protein refolding chaperone
MKTLRIVLMVVVALLIASPLMAAEGKKGRGGPRGEGGFDIFRMYERLDLNDKQKEQLAEIKKEFEGKLKELGEKARPNEEQRKALEEAKTSGKSRDEVRKIMEEKSTDAQKAARKEIGEVMTKIRDKVKAILTDEQVKKLEEFGKRGPGRRGGDKK